MPLKQQGIINHSSDIEREVEDKIEKVFSQIDPKVEELAKKRGLSISQVRLLQPLHQCTLVGDIAIYVVMSIHDLGGISQWQLVDWSSKPMNLASAIFMVERDLGFKDAFGFQFSRSWLDLDGDSREVVIAQIAGKYIEDEIARIEKLNRIVRLNPIFHGRDFLIDEKLVFVLSPFEDPFNTIYVDHIKPTVKRIQGLRCLRADDIYNNQSIIEDIWQYTNEARLLIAELTGKNANVFYETGIAHTIGKDVVLITQSMRDVPFDLRHLRCIVYEYTPRGTSLLEQNLENTIRNITARD